MDDATAADLEEDGLHIIAVNVNTNRADAESFLAKHTPNFEIVYDPDGALASQYKQHNNYHRYIVCIG